MIAAVEHHLEDENNPYLLCSLKALYARCEKHISFEAIYLKETMNLNLPLLSTYLSLQIYQPPLIESLLNSALNWN